MIISAQFENNNNSGVPAVNFSGFEPDAVAADSAFSESDVWNHLAAGFVQSGPISFSNLVNSTGTATGASLGISFISGGFNSSPGLPATYIYSGEASQTFLFTGLPPDESFLLFLYAYTDFGLREATFSVSSSNFNTIDGHPKQRGSAQRRYGLHHRRNQRHRNHRGNMHARRLKP
jgi:hypothetical protein